MKPRCLCLSVTYVKQREVDHICDSAVTSGVQVQMVAGVMSREQSRRVGRVTDRDVQVDDRVEAAVAPESRN